VLDARGIKVDAAARTTILACTELAQLKRWLRKAATARSVQELFESDPTSKPAARKAGKQGRSVRARHPSSKR
jgi:hypothetical protein